MPKIRQEIKEELRSFEKQKIEKKMDGIFMHNYYKNIETSVDDELNSFAKRMKE